VVFFQPVEAGSGCICNRVGGLEVARIILSFLGVALIEVLVPD
jgi:hypothetical protein